MKYIPFILIIICIFLAGCAKQPTQTIAKEFCNHQNVDNVYICGEYAKVVSKLPSGRATYFKTIKEVGPAGPEYGLEECKAPMNVECDEVGVCG